jgi:hypothetical protein
MERERSCEARDHTHPPEERALVREHGPQGAVVDRAVYRAPGGPVESRPARLMFAAAQDARIGMVRGLAASDFLR